MAKKKDETNKSSDVIPDVNGVNLEEPIQDMGQSGKKENLDNTTIVLDNDLSPKEVRDILGQPGVKVTFSHENPIRLSQDIIYMLKPEERIDYHLSLRIHNATPIEEEDEDIKLFNQVSGGGHAARLKDPFTPPRGYIHVWVAPSDVNDYKGFGYELSDSKYHLVSDHLPGGKSGVELYSMTVSEELYDRKNRGAAKESEKRLKSYPKNAGSDLETKDIQTIDRSRMTKN
jgi:hypothetical protein